MQSVELGYVNYFVAADNKLLHKASAFDPQKARPVRSSQTSATLYLRFLCSKKVTLFHVVSDGFNDTLGDMASQQCRPVRIKIS